MKRELVLLITLLVSHSYLSQRQANIWYFGDHAGLDFNSGSPVLINDGQTYYILCPGCHNEGTSVISDENGDLLFYTNGEKIWNSSHEVMANGDGLLGGASSTQSSLIVPQPGSSRFFYVFTTDHFQSSNELENGFRYSIVDMCLDEGLGDVVNNQKNILLLDSVAEKVTAVRHGNGIDYWVITHRYYSDAFYAYRLSELGIVDTVVSHIGAFHPTGVQNLYGAIGQLKASPNGEKLVIVNGNSGNSIAEFFDFNIHSGFVSNPVNLQWNSLNQFYGVSFSSDNTKLYISCLFNESGLYQFDLNAGNGNPDSIRDSRTQINISGEIVFPFWALQLATDGKIYVVRGGNNSSSYLSVIDSPNEVGLGCNYIENAIELQPMTVSFGLPNFIDSYDYSNELTECVVSVKDEEHHTPIVFPNPASEIVNFSFQDNQIRQVKLFDQRGSLVEDFLVSSIRFNLNVGHLSSGIYCVVIIDSNQKVFIEQVIKE